jgi:hypothetical protein
MEQSGAFGGIAWAKHQKSRDKYHTKTVGYDFILGH